MDVTDVLIYKFLHSLFWKNTLEPCEEAFESMAWLAPDAFIIMPFPAKYCVENYQTAHDCTAKKRVLVISRNEYVES